jgi:hypothetical protein
MNHGKAHTRRHIQEEEGQPGPVNDLKKPDNHEVSQTTLEIGGLGHQQLHRSDYYAHVPHGVDFAPAPAQSTRST